MSRYKLVDGDVLTSAVMGPKGLCIRATERHIVAGWFYPIWYGEDGKRLSLWRCIRCEHVLQQFRKKEQENQRSKWVKETAEKLRNDGVI